MKATNTNYQGLHLYKGKKEEQEKTLDKPTPQDSKVTPLHKKISNRKVSNSELGIQQLITIRQHANHD